MMFLLQYFIVQGRSYVGSLHSLKIYELEPWSIAAILSIRPAFFHLLFWRFFSESLSNISYRLSLPFQLISSLVLRLSSCCHFDTPLKSSFHDHSIPTHFNPELLTSSQIYREKNTTVLGTQLELPKKMIKTLDFDTLSNFFFLIYKAVEKLPQKSRATIHLHCVTVKKCPLCNSPSSILR